MRSNLIKKIIASTLIFSLTCSISMGLIQKANTAQASDWDDYFEHDYDDVEVYKGNLSIQGVTNYFGRPAVSIAIPSGLKIKDVDVENEPHDHIDENIQNGMIIIHGLRNGMTYQNLMLKLEDWSGIEYIYTINPFTVNGGQNIAPAPAPAPTPVPAPQPQVPQVPQIPNIPQNNNGFIGNDIEIFKGNVTVDGVTKHFGRPAVTISIPAGIKVKEVDIENEPHDHIDEYVANGKVVIHGLRNGMTYQNLMLKLEDWSGIEYIYTINPFTVNGNINNQVPNVPQIPQVPQNNQVPNVPQIPQVPQNNQVANVPNNNMQQGQKPNVNHKELPGYLKNIYRNVFNREVDNDGLGYWNNKLATGQIELDDFFKNLLSEREFIETAPMVEDKIKKLYTGIFQRQPDTEGFNFWVQKYKEELKDEGNEKEALRDIIDKMTDGQEFRELLVKLGLNDN